MVNPFSQEPIRVKEGYRQEIPESKEREADRKTSKFKTLINLPYLVEDFLQPGDIIMSYYPESSDAVALLIKAGQILETPVSKNSVNYVHAAIYLGNGKIAEAIGDEKGVDLKINELKSERFKIKEGKCNEYRIFRSTNDTFRKETARLAQQLNREEKSPGEVRGTYSYQNAFFSILKRTHLSEEALIHYMKAAHFAHTGEMPIDRHGPRNFHCSYLVSWVLQGAESLEVIARINNTLESTEKIEFPDLSKMTNVRERGDALEAWARKMVKTHEKKLRENLRLKNDAKTTTPQHLYKLFKDNPDLFEPVYRLIAPKQETELKPMRSTHTRSPDV